MGSRPGSTQLDLVRCDGHNLCWNNIEWKSVKMLEQILVLCPILLDIILEDHFLSRVVLEILLQGLVAHNLLLELSQLLLLDPLVWQGTKYFFDTTLHLGDLVPDDRDAFQHIWLRVSLHHLLVVVGESPLLTFNFRNCEVYNSTVGHINLGTKLFVQLVGLW